MSRRSKFLFVAILLFLTLSGFALLTYNSMQNKIAKRLEKGWVIPPLEVYSQGFALSVGRSVPLTAIKSELAHLNLQPERDFWLGTTEVCARLTSLTLKTRVQSTAQSNVQNCLWIKKSASSPAQLIVWDEHNIVQELYLGEPLSPVPSSSLFPRLITQFYDGTPILQRNTPLSETPLACLQAVTAIEDREYLEHGGISATGTLRALLRNLRARRWAEGGSTITQQLVKNFLLNSKKTLRRKLEEQVLAVLLEAQLSKDQILEMYLNIIYMGQSGPYQVRGFGSAAMNYFDKPLSELALPECALLAALVNNPGRYSPFTHAAQASARRELVLNKMAEAGMLQPNEVEAAKRAALPLSPESEKRAHAPYFVMTALKEFSNLEIEAEEGIRLYTTLDPELQTRATEAIQKQLPLIEKKINRPSLKEPLQVALVSVDLNSAQILALSGGRDYRTSQFNRALDSRRQIGSTIKPFVYLPALKLHDALSVVVDEPFEWKSGRQSWKPKNFEPGHFGSMPYFYALAHSYNIPAARVGQEVGLKAVAQTLRDAGVEEKVPDLPSLTLGAMELSPMSVAQIYSTLARLGKGHRLYTLSRVEDLAGTILYNHPVATDDFNLDAKLSAQVVGMLEQSLNLGTARAARALNVDGHFAGKTGTTSDSKDAWFAGFNPRLLTVVWVGYDDNTEMSLTGAGAALPIWNAYTTAIKDNFESADFAWPEGVHQEIFSREELLAKFPDLKDLPEQTVLLLPVDL